MTLAWPLVALVAVLLAWHVAQGWLTEMQGRRLERLQSQDILREELLALFNQLRDGLADVEQKAGKRLSELEEWRQRALNRNGGRE